MKIRWETRAGHSGKLDRSPLLMPNKTRRGSLRQSLFLEELEKRFVPSGLGAKPTGLAVLIQNQQQNSQPVPYSEFQQDLQTIANPYMSGVALQIDWKDIEPDAPTYTNPGDLVPNNLRLDRLNQLFKAAADAGHKWVQLDIFAGYWSPDWVLNSTDLAPGQKHVQTANFNVPYGHQRKGDALPLPLPFNTNTTYLDEYGSFIKAISIIYGGKPDFRVIAADGPTSVSEEFTEPDRPADIARWKSQYDYTFGKYIGAWQTMFNDFNVDFPNQYVSLAHGNGIDSPNANPNPAVTRLVGIGHRTFGGRFIFQSSALAAPPAHKPDAIASVIERIGIDGAGFEFGGTAENGPEKQGNTDQSPVAAALTIDRGLQLKSSGKGRNLHADYIVIHEPDVAADELQPVLAWAQPLVLNNDPNTHDPLGNNPLNVIMTAAEGEYGAEGIYNPSVTVYVTFSEPVTGFNKSKLQVTGGGISHFAQLGLKGLARQEYSFVLTPSQPNQVATVYLNAGVAKDAKGHKNTAAPPLGFFHFAHQPITTM
jgi:hypothetical protein